MSTNQAVWAMQKKGRYMVDDAPMPTPERNEVIIRVHAVAINPAEVVVQDLGIVYETYPMIPGCDVAGEIVEVRPEVDKFVIGDRVAGLLFQGAFQLYCATNVDLLVKLPDHVEFKEGCVLPLGFATSAVCLFEKDMLALALPQVDRAEHNGQILIIWGGSSSLGSCGVQQAVAAGYEVAVTASKRNFDYCLGIGASHVFDYASPNVVDDIVQEFRGRDCAGVFCSINAEGVVGKCSQIADRLRGNKVVAIPLPPAAPVSDKIPEEVTIVQCWHSGFEESAAVKDLFQTWLPEALATGTMKCRPKPEVVGKGLDKVQGGVDRLRIGVSATKLVVEVV